jgi:HK97 gp10 family phage protein
LSVKITKNGDPLKGSKDSVKKANMELVIRVSSQAKTLCPVDSGSLRKSIMWKVPEKTGGLEEGSPLSEPVEDGNGIVGTATDYAAYVEFGTKHQNAQPFLRPAVALEVLGPNGMNTLAKESIEEMKKSLRGRKTINGIL